MFVHAEQSSRARRKEWYTAWVKAVEESFPVVHGASGVSHVAGLSIRPADETISGVHPSIGLDAECEVDGLGSRDSWWWYVLVSYLVNL